MILIADSGSTKCDWALLDYHKNTVLKTNTAGLNPAVLSVSQLQTIILENEKVLAHASQIQDVYFYGTGCSTKEPKAIVEHCLQTAFKQAKIHVREDMFGACLAVTNAPGVVCILGTGSNSCFFDGNKVDLPFLALGYTLMDEAGGSYFGKQLLRDYFYKRMPEKLKIYFENRFELNPDILKNKLYKEEAPNVYLAQFSKFIYEYYSQEKPYFKSLLENGFNLFIDNRLLPDERTRSYPVHFIGSIAYFFKEILVDCLKNKNLAPGKIIRHPIDGLIDFHKQNM
ncbi:N-acetylglucosamine kinase [uncultured Mesonia sp.]|uniref:N-acetylglucosamine kinase n=1 Tax=uncultured Mesonia sp. TaxID=399731 RepID=UPI00374F0347